MTAKQIEELERGILVDALAELVQSAPDAVSCVPGSKNIGGALEDALHDAGYELVLSQQGVRGTSVIAVPRTVQPSTEG